MSVGSWSGGPACPARHRHPWSVRIQVWVTGIRKSWGPAPQSTVSVTTHRTTAVSATTDPDVGEMQGALINMFPGSMVEAVSKAVPRVKPDGTTGTDLYLSESGQPAFAADVSAPMFRLQQATQRPFDADSFVCPTQAAAWRTIPSWGLVAGQDKAIPAACERWMYGRAKARRDVEVPTSSHVAMISHPKITADLIDDAAKATG